MKEAKAIYSECLHRPRLHVRFLLVQAMRLFWILPHRLREQYTYHPCNRDLVRSPMFSSSSDPFSTQLTLIGRNWFIFPTFRTISPCLILYSGKSNLRSIWIAEGYQLRLVYVLGRSFLHRRLIILIKNEYYFITVYSALFNSSHNVNCGKFKYP